MTAGCGKLYKEDLSQCVADSGMSVTLTVDPATTDAARAEIDVRCAVMYVFDAEGRFLERRETAVGKEEFIHYPDHRRLTVVGWLNKYDVYDITAFTAGVQREYGHVHILKKTRTPGEYALPTDLFYGEITFDNTPGVSEHRDIISSRRSGQATITVRGIKEYFGSQNPADSDFYVVAKGSAGEIDFFGALGDWTASHTPETAFDPSSGNLVTGIFNLLPTCEESPLTVELWHRTDGKLYETSVDKIDDPIHISANYTTNILIDLSYSISVSVERSEWGVEHSWKTFN
jgi:hypothetical protein